MKIDVASGISSALKLAADRFTSTLSSGTTSSALSTSPAPASSAKGGGIECLRPHPLSASMPSSETWSELMRACISHGQLATSEGNRYKRCEMHARACDPNTAFDHFWLDLGQCANIPIWVGHYSVETTQCPKCCYGTETKRCHSYTKTYTHHIVVAQCA